MSEDSFTDVRMKGFRARTPVADVLRLIDDRIVALGAERIVSVTAAGRVLVERIMSPVDVPGFAKSAMDGYAMRGEGPYSITGTSLPGRPFDRELPSGHAIRIMTGAAMPRGAEAVVPVEHAIESEGVLRVASAPAPGKHIIAIGEDVAKGTEVLSAGRRLRPQDIGLLAAVGVPSVEVVRLPRVAILVTGNELLPPGSVPTGTQIVDSNSPMLAALITRDGGVNVPTTCVKDELAAVREAIRSADADVILVSGGSSVGLEDHAPRAVMELGELAVHGIAIKPASPAGIGFLRDPDRVVFLLPGHPVSCLCAYDLFAGRAIRGLGGRRRELPHRAVVNRLQVDLPSAIGRMDYVRVRVTDNHAVPILAGASRLSTTVLADGFILVPTDRDSLPMGEAVDVFLYGDS